MLNFSIRDGAGPFKGAALYPAKEMLKVSKRVE
jgi:hypothetical protein